MRLIDADALRIVGIVKKNGKKHMLADITDAPTIVIPMTLGRDCNNCGAKRDCKYAPELGTPVRWNCPLWQDKRKDGENAVD